jgi:hypothetical protein
VDHFAVSFIVGLVHAVHQGTGVSLFLPDHRLDVRVSLDGMGGEFAPEGAAALTIPTRSKSSWLMLRLR